MSLEEAQVGLARCLAERRSEFGWADEVRVVDGERGPALVGRVALARTGRSLVRAIGVAGIEDRLSEGPSGGWFDLADDTFLTRDLAGLADASELERMDGPVELRVERGVRALVRARDGTAGWIDRSTLSAADPPIPWGAVKFDLAPLGAVLAELCDTRYRLGGTTSRGIDCSGLVQRALRSCCPIPVPRHSRDQLALGRFAAGEDGEPRLCFVWTAHEAPCHVGVMLDSVVIHASRGRGRVVADEVARFRGQASRVVIVSDAALEAFVCSLEGRLHVCEDDLGLHPLQTRES